MRFSGLLLLLALACLGSALASSSSKRRYSPFRSDYTNQNDDQQQQQMTAPAFQKGNEYQFQYNAQIASGLIAQDEQSQSDAQQKAITRIQCQAKITFGSQRHAQLCLRQCRAGQLNERVKDEQQVQPMDIFEPRKISSDKQRQLDLCCQFDYADGVIERVQFDQDDQTWSKNIKRGVLQMIQLNLVQNNAQGLRQTDLTTEQQQQNDDEQQQYGQQQQEDPLAESFTIPEINVEGQCQTSYSINTANPSQRCASGNTPCSFNVTKSINFKQCSKIADVAFGYQTQQQQPQCAQCQIDWYKQQQKQQQNQQQGSQEQNNYNGYNAEQQANGQHPCAKCDPKEVKEQKVDRSTVLRYVLKCGDQQKQGGNQKQCQNCCQLERTELLSQYVYKNSKSENGQYSSAMHTVVAAQLKLRSVQPQQQEVQTQSSDKDETLMYSNEWETDQKRFYMFGDEEYPAEKSSPFHQVPTVEQARQALRKLMEATQNDNQQGIEPQQAIQLQRLVQMCRMSSQRQLKQIQQEAEQQQKHPQDKQKAEQIYMNALATCGTQNCVKQLAEKIKKGQTSQAKNAQALNSLQNLPAPSDSIVHTVQQLCQSEQVQSQSAAKQACWLTFGALVNELCQHKTQKAAQQSVFGAQSGFAQQEQCPSQKKQQYKQAMLELYEKADNTYDKVLALTALGNAGIDTATKQLEQIIKDQSEQRVVRVKAIDALRRLRTQQPRQIQQILLPIFQNTREQPQVRTAAFAILMYTLPEQSVVDQCLYTIGQEPNKQVQAFAYRTMKMLANSKNPVHQQVAKHIKNALKLTNVDEQQLRASGKWQMAALFSQEQQEGLFITLASTISQRSSLPAYAHAQIDSMFNDQFHINDVKLYMMQQEAEQWYENGLDMYMDAMRGTTRGQRRSSDSYEGQQQSLRDIYQALGIKSRRSSSFSSSSSIDQQRQYQSQQPFAVACLRISDVDQACIGLDEQAPEQMPYIAQQMLQALRQGGSQTKPSLSRVLEHVQQQQQIRMTIATVLIEKEAVIPMSCGLPLRMTSAMPALCGIEGTLKIEPDSAASGVKVKISVQKISSAVHIQKMECWTPFLASGVESIRSIESNIPLNAELSASHQQGLTLKYKLPQQNTQLFGAHSLPVCYATVVDEKNGLVREPRHVRAIQDPKLERQQHEANTVVGEKNLGIPLHIHAHYHWPSQPTRYEEFVQMLMATENMFHVTYRPNQESPREAVFRLSGEHFQPSNGQPQQFQQQLKDFYANKFDQADSDEQEEYEQEYQLDNHSQRRQKLQKFLGSYQPRQQYKHSLKMSAQTIGGSKEFKCQAEVQAHCDSKLQACSMQMEAQRNPMNNEPQKWTLKAQAQLVMPETVNTVQEMDQLSQRNNKFTGQASAQWGCEQKQQINIRIKGEQVQRSAWRQLQQGQAQKQGNKQQQQQQNRLKRRTAFLNKFDLECQYSGLKPTTQNTFVRALELVKSAYFWNSNSQFIPNNQKQQQDSQANGKVLATMMIDPITQKHCNISVKTPSQYVRLQQIELPVQARPFPLVTQNAQSIQSIGQFIARQELKNRAECTVDGSRVNTFDDQEFKSPLSTKCYSVLAKDCTSDEPNFVVLMKSIQQCNQRNGQNCPKMLKVISPEETIVCQPKCCSGGSCQSCNSQQQSQQIQCKVNGQTVNDDDDTDKVDFNNAQKSDVTVHVPGSIAVRFNGRKAWLKVASIYKNGQCGLCGHYDDSGDDEWRMGNNQITSDLGQFHRSYALQGQEECNAQNLDEFYQQNGKQISKYQQQYDSDEDDQDQGQNNNNNGDDDNDDEDDEQVQQWDQEKFNGDEDSSEENNYNNDEDEDEEDQDQLEQTFGGSNRRGNCNGKNKNSRRCQKTQPPVQRTMVIEMNHDVCFSTKPVKQCPRGTVPSNRMATANDDDNIDSTQNNRNDDEDEESSSQAKNVPMVCMSRSSQEARQLLRQYRRGQRVLNVGSRGHSYAQRVRDPQSCRRP